MSFVDVRGGYLYQHVPDLIPEGRLTETEMHLWGMYWDAKEARTKR